jgi:purine-binding chemotaxis protein CheW
LFRFVQEADSNEYLGFIVDSEYYCISVLAMQEIQHMSSISRVPNVPLYVEGAINLRGKIVRIINLRKWLELPWKNFDEKSRILIVSIKEGIFGLIIDDLDEVFSIDKSVRHEIPQVLQQEPSLAYIKSFILNKDHVFIEINPDEIRKEKDLKPIEKPIEN